MPSLSEEKIKEFIFQAHQAGKQETSQLFKQIENEIKSIKDTSYTKDQIDDHHTKIMEKLDGIDEQVKYTNGKVAQNVKSINKLKLILFTVAIIIVTTMILRGSELLAVIGILL